MLPFSQWKTGIYYLRTRPAVNAIQYTVDRNMAEENPTSLEHNVPIVDDEVCLSCSAWGSQLCSKNRIMSIHQMRCADRIIYPVRVQTLTNTCDCYKAIHWRLGSTELSSTFFTAGYLYKGKRVLYKLSSCVNVISESDSYASLVQHVSLLPRTRVPSSRHKAATIHRSSPQPQTTILAMLERIFLHFQLSWTSRKVKINLKRKVCVERRRYSSRAN